MHIHSCGRSDNSVARFLLLSASPVRYLSRVNTVRRLARGLMTVAGVLGLIAAAPSKLAAQVDLALNVTDSPDPVLATGTVTYAVAIANGGVTTATGVTYTMNVPASATYLGFTAGTGASCTGMAINANGPGTVTCTHPAIAPSPDASFTIQLRLNVQGTVSVSSSVTSTQTDTDSADNSVTSLTTVNRSADVTVALSAPTTVTSGAAMNYSLSVSNAGPDAASALRVSLPLPAGFVQSGALPSGCGIASGTVTCDIAGSVASGATVTVGNIPGRISAASGSTITATATVDLQPGAPAFAPRDPDTGNNSAVNNVSVTAGSDLALTKTRSTAGPYFVGSGFDFVLTPSYSGDVPSGLTIVDVVPANYTIGAVPASQNGWSCVVSGQTVTCSRASGGVAGLDQSLGTIGIPVTISAAGSPTNSATITASSPADPNTSNDTATDGGATLLLPSADLTLTKTGPSPALVVVGVPFSWTLRAANIGPSAFDGTVTVTDNLPAGVTVNSVSATGWNCSSLPVTGPSVITCTRVVTSGSPLASGGALPPIVFDATADAPGTIMNNAVLTTTGENVADPDAANNTVDQIVTASAGVDGADLRVVKTVDLTTVPAGDVLTYTVEVVNDGTGTADNVTLSDDLQALINNGVGATGQGFVAVTVTMIGTASAVNCSSAASGPTGQLVTCTIPSLPPCVAGVTCPQVTIAVRPGGEGGVRTNLTSASSSITADPNTANNSGSISTTVDPRADVSITASATPPSVAAGQTLTYVMTAQNNGPSSAASVIVSDDLPLGVIFVSATPSSGSCSVTPTVNTVTTLTNRTVTCDLGTLANAAQQTVTSVVRPGTATRGTTITNNATVTTTTIEPTTPGISNNSASVGTSVTDPSLDLLVTNEESLDPVALGSPWWGHPPLTK
jgi:uncharacterized repeat protein (TIGR01451 family)